jgi:hypothetical protein
MADELTPLGVSVPAPLRAQPMHGYEMFQTLVERHADHIVKVRPGSLYHAVYEITGAVTSFRSLPSPCLRYIFGETTPRLPRLTTVSGRWRPGRPRSWHFAVPASRPPDT